MTTKGECPWSQRGGGGEAEGGREEGGRREERGERREEGAGRRLAFHVYRFISFFCSVIP